jgi:hypothetical protein
MIPIRPCTGSTAKPKGLGCPQEVFTQLYHDEAGASSSLCERSTGGAFAGRSRNSRVLRVDRSYQDALDEACARATQFGIVDDREEVIAHWRDAGSWFVPPVIVAGDLLGTSVGYELLVVFTRLGNLLGLLDRQQVPEVQRHLVWVGRRMERTRGQ